MQAQQPEMVGRARDPHLRASHLDQLGSFEELLHRAVAVSRGSGMKVDGQRYAREAEGAARRLELLCAHADVDVAGRPQAVVGVETGNGPALDEQRLHASGAEESHGLGDLAHPQRGAKSLKAIRLAKDPGRGQPLPGRRIQPAPHQARFTVHEQGGRQSHQALLGDVEHRRQ